MTDETPFFPEIEPYNTGRLRVSALHELYYEECGNPNGKPVVFLHGGPGGGVSPAYRRYFDPDFYRIVLFDQRGAGKSTPSAELQENTTWKLVEDIETLRRHLGLERWLVFGGSWGSTLALTYAVTYPERVIGLILRGIFLCRKMEIDWFYQHGASFIYPDAWDNYLAPIPEEERGDLVAAYYRRLTSPDRAVRVEAATAWSVWEASTSHLFIDTEGARKFEEDIDKSLAFARIECHYFTNAAFFPEDGWLLRKAPSINHIPTRIAQGRYDIVCPIRSAWDLKKVMPAADLRIVPDAGHSSFEPGIARELVQATEDFKRLFA
ncbi:MAG TPA: prolyl aminopeptidase [Anaerolineaceae bacterium]